MPTHAHESNVVEVKAGKCPCGSSTFERGITSNCILMQAITVNGDGSEAFVGESTVEKIHFRRQPKYMRCTSCKRRVYNPDFRG